MSATPDLDPTVASGAASRHVRLGFVLLAAFATLGLGLEAAHACKAPAYLDVGREATRLCLRLGHAHGALLALVNVVYGVALRVSPQADSPATSRLLVAATVLMPAGFVLGGLFARGADPGAGVLLVPLGAVALIAFALTAARRWR